MANDSEAQPKPIAAAREGLRSLSLWLQDRVRGGLGTLQGQPFVFWDNIAARMVDAYMPGVAGWVRRLSVIPASGDDWPARLLEQFARLYLLSEAMENYETLGDDMRANIHAALGWPPSPETLSAPVESRWVVLGGHIDYEIDFAARDKMTAQNGPFAAVEDKYISHLWLWVMNPDGRAGLIRQSARNDAEKAGWLAVGETFNAALAYHPGGYPLRAEVGGVPSPRQDKNSADGVQMDGMKMEGMRVLPGYGNLREAIGAYMTALARNPWLDVFPMIIRGCSPRRHSKGWQLVDEQQGMVAISPDFEKGWPLLSVSGGRAITVFGRWDGAALTPMSAWTDERFYSLGPAINE